MSTGRHPAALTTICLWCCVILLAAGAAADSRNKTNVPTLRWAEGTPGCTFTRSDDGKYRYGLWTDDLSITLAVDSQELQKARRRLQPMFGVLLTYRYRGTGTLEVRNDNISLEFLKHSHVVHRSLDPDDLSESLQSGADALNDEIAHEIIKHPEKKAEKEALLQAYQEELSEMLEFLSTRSLRPAKLEPGTPEVNGWLFFSTKSKWVGDWKKQEDFVLRIRFENRVFEFPFTLPPNENDLILRKRGN
jgi:hypothetical protein